MSKEKKTMLCPFKKIVERDYNAHTGKGTFNERFAPCAGERCMAFRGSEYNPRCARLEDPKQ